MRESAQSWKELLLDLRSAALFRLDKLTPAHELWLALILVSAIGWTVAFLFFARFRNRIAYWL